MICQLLYKVYPLKTLIRPDVFGDTNTDIDLMFAIKVHDWLGGVFFISVIKLAYFKLLINHAIENFWIK